jgi:hypothetical protein
MNSLFSALLPLVAALTAASPAFAQDCPSVDQALKEAEDHIQGYRITQADASLAVAVEAMRCGAIDDPRVVAHLFATFALRHYFGEAEESLYSRYFAAAKSVYPEMFFDKDRWGAEALGAWYAATDTAWGKGQLKRVGDPGTGILLNGCAFESELEVAAVPLVVRTASKLWILDVQMNAENPIDVSAEPVAPLAANRPPGVETLCPGTKAVLPALPETVVVEVEVPRKGLPWLAPALLAGAGAAVVGTTFGVATGTPETEPSANALKAANLGGWLLAGAGGAWMTVQLLPLGGDVQVGPNQIRFHTRF